MLKQGLELKTQQRLSPIQIQAIGLIQLPIQELEQAVRNEIAENPVLDDTLPEKEEEDRDISIEELKEDDYIPSYRVRSNNWGPDERPQRETFSDKESFAQSLVNQLGFKNLDDRQKSIAVFVIGSLSDDGLLRRPVEMIVDDIAFRLGMEVSVEEVEEMIGVVQEFEPVGVGARDLRECLLLQLRSMEQTESVRDAEKILEVCYDEFVNRHLQKVSQRLGLGEERMKAALARIVKLNPSPGGQTDDSYDDKLQQVVPDFLLEADGDRLSFSMPRASIPELRINKRYTDILLESKGSSERAQKEAAAFVKQKIDSAKWFIEALKQRQNTLQKTMAAILEYQHDFFLEGDESKLKPMVLKDIAAKTGFDISTISRVVNSKYIETHFGILPLKYLFSEGMSNSEGEEISTRELKKALKECVDAEDKHKPLTDEQLVEVLDAKGYKVARRTVAKYRSQLGIPLARFRREL
ncbi:MAG: RNA polymerase factor sigma-54 [Bacteroidales bacterium]|nr:RNA polymerase factor sigma-54 [Bacteroidales bacterium]